MVREPELRVQVLVGGVMYRRFSLLTALSRLIIIIVSTDMLCSRRFGSF